MSKQDGAFTRTAADLERKYNFGQSFAEVFGLARDAQQIAIEATKELESLTPEEIFNRLTNYGEVQGIYRGDDGDIYINANYIKSGTISADRINLTGAITWSDLGSEVQTTINSAGGISASQCRTIINDELVSSPNIIGGMYWSSDQNTNLDLLDQDETALGFGSGMILYRNNGGMPIFSVSSTVLVTEFRGFNNNEFLKVDSTSARPQGKWNFIEADEVTGLYLRFS